VREPKGIRNNKEANAIWKILLQLFIYLILHQKNTGTYTTVVSDPLISMKNTLSYEFINVIEWLKE
jgi:hypothetical protein